MYTRRKIEIHVVLFFVRWHLIFFLLWASAVCILYDQCKFKFLAIPFLPIATIGTAVAFYVGFKNHASYERLWEARKVWGAITNHSRSWAAAIISFAERRSVENSKSFEQELIYRHLAWINILRLQLRAGRTCEGDTIKFQPQIDVVAKYHGESQTTDTTEGVITTFLDQADRGILNEKGNIANLLLCTQLKRIRQLKDDGLIDGGEHTGLQLLIYSCFDEQGKSERIKTFPFPRQYAYFSLVFVNIFTLLLPFGLIGEMAKLSPEMIWLTIPFSTLISWIFLTMEQVGDASEDPFEGGINDVPLSAICRNIEIDLRRLLGEEQIPPPLEPVNHILL